MTTTMNNNKVQSNANVNMMLKEQIGKGFGYDGCDLGLKVDWVYGIRYKDVKYFVEFNGGNEVVYFVGRLDSSAVGGALCAAVVAVCADE